MIHDIASAVLEWSILDDATAMQDKVKAYAACLRGVWKIRPGELVLVRMCKVRAGPRCALVS